MSSITLKLNGQLRPTEDRSAGERAGAASEPTEEPGYLDQGPEQVYYVLHRPPTEPIGRVLLAGPFASERHRSYISWVRWARHLAAAGLEVMHFDYRGVGESTGRFTQMSFGEWLDDLRLCARSLATRGQGLPLVLHGWRLGALLAARAFSGGIGDALLLWSPPVSARDMLHEALRRRICEDYAQNPQTRKTRDDYVAEMESGKLVEVDGFEWSQRLWEQSADLVLDVRDTPDHSGEIAGRPWNAVQLKLTYGPLALSYRANPRGLNPPFSELFDQNLKWIRQSVMLTVPRRSHAADPAD